MGNGGGLRGGWLRWVPPLGYIPSHHTAPHQPHTAHQYTAQQHFKKSPSQSMADPTVKAIIIIIKRQ